MTLENYTKETKIVDNIKFYTIPDHSDYLISRCGKVYSNFAKKIIGTYYQFSDHNHIIKVGDALLSTFGTKERIGVYIPTKFRKLSNKKIKQLEEKLENRQNILDLWYQSSGSTHNYQNYLDSLSTNVDLILESINTHCRSNQSVQLLDRDRLILDWGIVITEEYLSFTLLLYFLQRVKDKVQGNFMLKTRLYEKEYKIAGRILTQIFRVSNDIPYEDDSDEVIRHKEIRGNYKSADHTMKRNRETEEDDTDYKIDYMQFQTSFEDNSCAEFVHNNIQNYDPDKLSTNAGWGNGCNRISRKLFNDGFRYLISINKEYSLTEIFVLYSEYFFVQLSLAINRLDHDLFQKIFKEVYEKC